MHDTAPQQPQICSALRYEDLYHPPDVEEAYAAYGASCGPVSLAAILQRSVMSLRPFLGNFEWRGYCNVRHLLSALSALGLGRRTWTLNASALHQAFLAAEEPSVFPPLYGLAFVQWRGPWLKPGVPVAVAYRYTHWVGIAMTEEYGQMVYDINAWSSDDQRGAWVPVAWWEDEIPPAITCTIPRADGGYYVRTALEVQR